jgi:hypothetical protein
VGGTLPSASHSIGVSFHVSAPRGEFLCTRSNENGNHGATCKTRDLPKASAVL